jgi:hypothetical protein
MATPAHCGLLVRILAWSVLLPVLKHLLALPTLARLLWAPAEGKDRWPEREQQIVRLAQWIYQWGGGMAQRRCLERSLLIYRFLSMANANPLLVIGTRKAGPHLCAHAWVTVEGQPCGEAPAALEEFVPIITFGSGGRAQPPSPGTLPVQR